MQYVQDFADRAKASVFASDTNHAAEWPRARAREDNAHRVVELARTRFGPSKLRREIALADAERAAQYRHETGVGVGSVDGVGSSDPPRALGSGDEPESSESSELVESAQRSTASSDGGRHVGVEDEDEEDEDDPHSAASSGSQYFAAVDVVSEPASPSITSNDDDSLSATVERALRLGPRIATGRAHIAHTVPLEDPYSDSAVISTVTPLNSQIKNCAFDIRDLFGGRDNRHLQQHLDVIVRRHGLQRLVKLAASEPPSLPARLALLTALEHDVCRRLQQRVLNDPTLSLATITRRIPTGGDVPLSFVAALAAHIAAAIFADIQRDHGLPRAPAPQLLRTLTSTTGLALQLRVLLDAQRTGEWAARLLGCSGIGLAGDMGTSDPVVEVKAALLAPALPVSAEDCVAATGFGVDVRVDGLVERIVLAPLVYTA